MKCKLLLLICLLCAGKVNAQIEQLTSFVEDNYQLQRLDSTAYKYKPGNTYPMRIDSTIIAPHFDTLDMWSFAVATPDTNKIVRQLFFYNAALLRDSTYQLGYANGVFYAAELEYYKYDADHNTTDFCYVRANAWPPVDRDTQYYWHRTYVSGNLTAHEQHSGMVITQTLYSYTGSNLVREEQNIWDTINNVWEHQALHLYTYDAANNMLTDTTGVWNRFESKWDYNNAIHRTWNAANLMARQQVYQFKNWSWIIIADSRFVYNASGQLVSDTADIIYGTVLKPKYVENYYYNAAGQRDTTIAYEWKDGVGYQLFGMFSNTYTASGLWATEQYHKHNPNTSVWTTQFEKRIHYTYRAGRQHHNNNVQPS